ncbi:MAG: competence/damage-inducible protein A [Bacillota bacterium]
MKAEIVLVGTELLLGQISDTNGSFLARELAGLGIDLFHIQMVGDNPERFEAVVREALERSDLVLITGGLGPTRDDLTREVLGRILHEPLEFNSRAWSMVEDFFIRRGRNCSDNNRRQAMYSKSMEILVNRRGSAPGIWVYLNGKVVAAMPGVPGEMEAVFREEVAPRLKNTGALPVLVSRFIRMVGIGESAMEDKIADLMAAQGNPTIAPYAGQNEVYLRISAKAPREGQAREMINGLEKEVLDRLGDYCYGFDGDTLPCVVARLLEEKGFSISAAESCTGGLFSDMLTDVPGISRFFSGGVVAYDNSVKEAVLGVRPQTLNKHGAVSCETAAEMAEGVRHLLHTDLGIGITGIAGPGGGTPEKPVGLAFISLALPGGEVRTEKHRFPWGREANKLAASKAALALLWRELKSGGTAGRQ